MRTKEQNIKRRGYQRKYQKEHSEVIAASKKRWCATNPEKRKRACATWKVANPEKVTAVNKLWYAANRVKVAVTHRRYHLRKKFGMSVEDFDNRLSKQGGCCVGCNVLFSKTPYVDHDHTTGFVRGLLCQKCNTILGQAVDAETTLLSLVDYLRRSRYEQTKQGDR